MSKVNYNPKAVKAITVWEPVCISVADELSSQLWAEHPMMRNLPKDERERCGKRWRRAGIMFGKGQYRSREDDSGVYFDNKEEALAWLKEQMIPKYVKRVEAGVYTPLAGKTKPGFSHIKISLGLDPSHHTGDNFWNDYFDFILYGKTNKRNSYAYRTGQYTWDEVPAYAFRVEKRKLYIPA
jgi:hypothetical protein